MANEPAATDEEFHWTIAVARLILPDDDPPPGPAQPERRPDSAARLWHRRLRWHLARHGRSRQPRARVARGGGAGERVRRARLQSRTATHGLSGVHRRRQRDSSTPRCGPSSLSHADSALPRAQRHLGVGFRRTPPAAPTSRARTSAVSSLLARYVPGYDFDREELTTLFNARGADFNAVVDAADNAAP